MTFESLEKRRLLNADPIAAARSSAAAPQAVRGLLRYESNSNLLATQFAANPTLSEDVTQQSEVQQHWPSSDISDAWTAQLSGDFNGDDRIDTVGFVDSSAWIQLNTGDEFYLLPWGEALPFGSEVIGLGDVDGDDLTDIISFNEMTNEVWVSVNSLSDGFQNQLWTRWSESLSTQPFLGDFDQDGLTDVLVGTLRGRWLLGKSSGTSFVEKDWGSYSVFDWQDMVPGDFNGDGRVDLAARAPDRTWWVWQGNEQGLDGAKYWGHWKMGTGWTDIRVADFNADGMDDILGRSAEGTLHVATAVEKESATGTDSEFHSWRWVTGWVPGADWRNLTIVDVTQDGLPDIVGQAKDGTWWVGENIDQNFRNFYLDRTTVHVDHVTVAADSNSDALLELPKRSDSNEVQATDATVGVGPLRVHLKADGHLVVEGNGQQVRAIEFLSESGSLIPISTFGTSGFNQLNRNEQVSIRLAAAKPVTIEGELILGVKWNREKNANDLQVIYDVVNVPAIVDANSFGSTSEFESESEAKPTQTLHEQYVSRFPQAIASLELRSMEPDEIQPEETFVASSVDEPDDPELANPEPETPEPETPEPETSAPSESLEDDPSLQEPTDEEVTHSEQTPVEDVEAEPVETESVEIEESEPADTVPTVAEAATMVELTLNEDRQFILDSPGPIYALRIESPSASLLTGTSAQPFDRFVVADSGLVFYASETPVSGTSIPLDVQWQNGEATDRLFAEFGNADSEWQPVFLFGERIAVRSESDELATSDNTDTESDDAEDAAFSIRLNASNQFVIAANQQVLAVNFRSTNKGLVPGSSPAPFELFVANSQSQITLGTFGRLVTFDGEVTLDVGWDDTISAEELIIELGDEDGAVVELVGRCEDSACAWSL